MAEGRLRVAVEVVYPDESVGTSGWIHLNLADQYGDDAAFAHGWIGWQLRDPGYVELVDDEGGIWPFHLGTISQFAVWAVTGND